MPKLGLLSWCPACNNKREHNVSYVVQSSSAILGEDQGTEDTGSGWFTGSLRRELLLALPIIGGGGV